MNVNKNKSPCLHDYVINNTVTADIRTENCIDQTTASYMKVNSHREVKNSLSELYSSTDSHAQTVFSWQCGVSIGLGCPDAINSFLQFNVGTGERWNPPLHRTRIWISMHVPYWRASKTDIGTMLELIQGLIDSHWQHVWAHSGIAARILVLTSGVCGCGC